MNDPIEVQYAERIFRFSPQELDRFRDLWFSGVSPENIRDQLDYPGLRQTAALLALRQTNQMFPANNGGK